MNLAQILQISAGVLFPENCTACGKHSACCSLPICEACRQLLLSQKNLPASSSAHLPEIWSCLPYEGAIKECIKQFKYSGQKRIILFFEDLTRHFLDENNFPRATPDLIVPVPIHPARRLARGYNQSELIAGALSDLIHVPFSMSDLIKTKNTPAQIELSENDSMKNLRGSFLAPRRSRAAGKSILLVDDVMTTGATLETCAKELLHAGAKSVSAFTIARTL